MIMINNAKKQITHYDCSKNSGHWVSVVKKKSYFYYMIFSPIIFMENKNTYQ